MKIQGHVDPRFAEVREEFERNFTERGDVGASVCVIADGEEVVNLWGGEADPASGSPWQEDTLTIVMSTTKGATALCAHMLADRGQLDIDAPVARYWPEFAAQGKGNIPVRMLLNHQAGLPGLRRPIPAGGFCDWDSMVDALANEAPFWEPGTRIGYHAFTYGWLVGEVIRRVSGRSLGTFFREEVAEPLGLDFWIGLPEVHAQQVTPLRPEPNPVADEGAAVDPDPNSPLHAAIENTGGYTSPGGWNEPMYCRAELGGSGGMTNARSLAHMYAPLAHGGASGAVRLVDPLTITRMGTVTSAIGADATAQSPFRVTLGFMKAGVDLGLPDSTFGHGGWGGSAGFADPQARLAFGYVMNQMNSTDRFGPLATAVYRSLGYRQGKYGLWARTSDQ